MATIAALRRMRLSSPEIAFSLSLPASSVTNELRRLGLNKLPRLEPRPPVVRYERAAPGDLVHMDIKKRGASRAWATPSPVTAPSASGARAGNTCTCAWTTTAAWPTPSCCQMRRPAPPPAS